MGILNKIKLVYKNFLIASANVQQNAINDIGDSMLSDNGIEHVIQNHTMSSALLNGEITHEVKLLRARYYKVLDKMDSITIKTNSTDLLVEMDSDKDINYEYTIINKFNYLQLKKVKLDEFDKQYPLEMVIKNTLIYSEDFTKLVTTDYKFNFELGEMASKYSLRRFAELVKIKMINNDESLLEFYVPFVDFECDTNKPYQAMINDIEKAKTDNEIDRLFTFGDFGFHTDEKDLGVSSMRDFVYSEPKFIRMVKFNDNYVIKYKVTNVVKNFFIGDDYSMEELDKLYEEKAPRKN